VFHLLEARFALSLVKLPVDVGWKIALYQYSGLFNAFTQVE
jgi:hypothetical protein